MNVQSSQEKSNKLLSKSGSTVCLHYIAQTYYVIYRMSVIISTFGAFSFYVLILILILLL